MAEDFTSSDARAFREEIESNKRDYDPDLEVEDIGDGLPEGIQFYQTSTTAFQTGRDPRTVRAAYDQSTQVMYVVFYTGAYYMYADVPPDVWQSFKNADSKGEFLWNEGFDSRGPKGAAYAYQPVDMTTLSQKRKAALTANLNQAKIRQAGLKGRRTVKTLYPKGQRYSKPNRGGF